MLFKYKIYILYNLTATNHPSLKKRKENVQQYLNFIQPTSGRSSKAKKQFEQSKKNASCFQHYKDDEEEDKSSSFPLELDKEEDTLRSFSRELEVASELDDDTCRSSRTSNWSDLALLDDGENDCCSSLNSVESETDEDEEISLDSADDVVDDENKEEEEVELELDSLVDDRFIRPTVESPAVSLVMMLSSFLRLGHF